MSFGCSKGVPGGRKMILFLRVGMASYFWGTALGILGGDLNSRNLTGDNRILDELLCDLNLVEGSVSIFA